MGRSRWRSNPAWVLAVVTTGLVAFGLGMAVCSRRYTQDPTRMVAPSSEGSMIESSRRHDAGTACSVVMKQLVQFGATPGQITLLELLPDKLLVGTVAGKL